MTSWPAFMPSPLLGLEEQPPDTTLRSAMDTGPAKTRPRFSAAPRDFDGWSCRLSDADKTAFDDWYVNDIARGALSFDLVNPTTKVVESARLKGRPKYILVEPQKWRVTISLEVLP